ncbi:MAG: phytanoyl-CoA dioxygenase family protein, partial [Rectinemataceae bacterium]
YNTEGYLLRQAPMLGDWKFKALKTHFAELLAALKPGQRPELMDVPHFIAKPPGGSLPVPWQEDSNYWKGILEPMEVVTVWLALDDSDEGNICMYVIPRTHDNGFSEYYDVPADK